MYVVCMRWSDAGHMNTTTSSAKTRWDPVLSGLRADALDCMQCTVAAIADEAHGTGAHLALGCEWRFPTRGPDGRLGVQSSVVQRMAQARDVFGFETSEPRGPLSSAELRRLADDAPVYVVAEAYDLRWLPYARAAVRYRKMPHTFLLERAGSGYTVVDAYYADTEWGKARPQAWTLSPADFDRAVDGQAEAIRVEATGVPRRMSRAAVMRENAMAAEAAGPDIDAYIDTARAAMATREGMDRLLLDIWHLCRERLLYTAWLGDHEASATVRAVVEQWRQLAGQSYLASRRSRRGAPPNVGLVDDMARLLRSDAALMLELGRTFRTADTAAVEDVVREAFGVSLRIDASTIDLTTSLRTLAGFDSFRLVEIVDRIETRLGVPLPPEASAADLADLAGLCRLFSGAIERSLS